MKYAIIKVSNGTFTIDSEWGDNLTWAKVAFHSLCQSLWNAPDVATAMVMIADENLDAVEGYKEYIHHEAAASAPVEDVVEEPNEEPVGE